MVNEKCGTFLLCAITMDSRGNDSPQRNYLNHHSLQVIGVDGGVRGIPEGKDRIFIEVVGDAGQEKLRIIEATCEDQTVFMVKKIVPTTIKGMVDITITDGDKLNGMIRCHPTSVAKNAKRETAYGTGIQTNRETDRETG